MNIKIFPVLIAIITATVVMACCGGISDNKNSELKANTAFITLINGNIPDSTEAYFKEGEYTFEFSEAVVKEGSYSGIEIEFVLIENDSSKLYLSFELPAAGKFNVYWKNGGVEAQIPSVPCTLTEKDFQGLKNALYETEQPTFIELKRKFRKSNNNIGVNSCPFGIYTLEISKAEFKKECFSMDCKFKGKIGDKYSKFIKVDYTIEGEFSINKMGYLISQVD